VRVDRPSRVRVDRPSLRSDRLTQRLGQSVTADGILAGTPFARQA